MKKTIFSTILFILFLLFIAISYLSFFGYETDRFNQIIKSEIKKSNKDITLDFEKISILLDIKKLTLFTKFINTNLNYSSISIPLRSLRADVELNSLIKKKPGIKKIILVTEYLDLDSKKIKPLIKKLNLQEKNFKNIKNVRFNSTFQLEFDEDLKIKDNFKVKGTINYANIKILDEYQARDLYTEFFYEKDNLELKNLSWRFNNVARKDIKWGIHGDHGIYGDLKIKLAKKKYDIDATFRTKIPIALNFIKTPGINYSFSEKNTSQIKTKFSINKNKTTFFKIFRLEDKDNEFQIKGLHLDKNYNLINFKEIKVKTSVDNNINNDFKIINKKKKIDIQGKIFDAKILIKNLTKDGKKNNFLKKISKDIEIDFNRILKDEKFPIKNFRLVGKINKGAFEKISAKSDFLTTSI